MPRASAPHVGPDRDQGPDRPGTYGRAARHQWLPPEVRRVLRTPSTHLAALPSLAGRASRASLRRLAMHALGARTTRDEPPAATTRLGDVPKVVVDVMPKPEILDPQGKA